MINISKWCIHKDKTTSQYISDKDKTTSQYISAEGCIQYIYCRKIYEHFILFNCISCSNKTVCKRYFLSRFGASENKFYFY